MNTATGPTVHPLSDAAAQRLTTRQATVLRVIQRYYAATGEGCAARYVARRLEVYHEAVRGHFAALYRKGWLVSETAPAIPRRPFLTRRER